jgi:CPA1 family monovalent cation:H+ antiporter
MQTAYTVLILLMLVGVSRLVGRVIPAVAIGADWRRRLAGLADTGLHVALDPELFLFLFLPPLLFSDGWRMPKREFWRLRGPI